MKRIAMISIPLHGHVNPTLGITEALVKRGHDVLYLTLPEFREKVEATGARLEPYGATLPHMTTADPEQFRQNFGAGKFALMMAEWRKTAPHLEAILNDYKPDVIFYDFFVNPAHLHALQKGIPAVKFFTTYAASKSFNLWDEIRKWSPDSTPAANLPMDDLMMMMAPARANLVFIPRAFHYQSETFDETFHFVGPCLRTADTGADSLTLKANGKPLVLVSMGSVLTDQPAFYKVCFEAFRNRPVDVVMAIGKGIDPRSLGDLPENVTLLKHIPQLTLLPKASAFISHGGMNSTMESLAFGVPLIVTPHTEEQEATARRVQELQLGLHLKPADVTAGVLGKALDQILGDATFKANASQMAARIAESGGTMRAVDLVESLA